MFNNVYEDNALKKTFIFKRIERLNESREDWKNDARPGCLSNLSWWQKYWSCAVVLCVLTDEWLSGWYLIIGCVVYIYADKINIVKSSDHTIITEQFELKISCAKIIPKFSAQEQKLRMKEFWIDCKNSI